MSAKFQMLANRITQALWWAASLNRYHDQTGIAHVVHDGGTLCGARPFDMGGSFSSAAATGCHECRRCRAIINRTANNTVTKRTTG